MPSTVPRGDGGTSPLQRLPVQRLGDMRLFKSDSPGGLVGRVIASILPAPTSLVAVITFGVVLVSVLSPERLSAQQSAAPEGASWNFEVASVKPTRQPFQGFQLRASSFTMPSTTLQQLISFAYMIPLNRVLGGDDWTRAETFEIRATIPKLSGTSVLQSLEIAQRMVRSLLAERFAVKVIEEKRMLPASVLRIKDPQRKTASGLRPPDADCESTRLTASKEPIKPPDPSTRGVLPPPRYCSLALGEKGGMVILHGKAVSMGELLTYVEMFLGKPAHDETGIRGNFGLEVAFGKSYVPIFGGLSANQTTSDGPSIATAFANDLNISIRSEERPVPVVVVAHAERPTPN